MTPLAHIGHWTTSLAFFGPVIVLPIGLWVATLLDRRARDPEED